MSFLPEQINEYIRARRSVFVDQFEQGKQIPDEIILEILENANNAPTHKVTEPWRFVVFSGNGLKTLATQQAAIYKEHAGSKFKQNKYDKLQTSPLQCSHIIAICMNRNTAVPEMEEIAAVACAVENIYLSLPPYGIGGYWSTGGVTYMDAAKQWLGLSNDDKLMGFFFLGYIKTVSVPRRPGPVTEKITWIRE